MPPIRQRRQSIKLLCVGGKGSDQTWDTVTWRKETTGQRFETVTSNERICGLWIILNHTAVRLQRLRLHRELAIRWMLKLTLWHSGCLQMFTRGEIDLYVLTWKPCSNLGMMYFIRVQMYIYVGQFVSSRWWEKHSLTITIQGNKIQ